MLTASLRLQEDVAYALRLSRAGVPVEAHVYNGGVHGFDGLPGPLAAQFTADLRAVFHRLLQPAAAGAAWFPSPNLILPPYACQS